jgi:hypothetical protein
MWKTLGGFSAQISRFQHILPHSSAQINCSGSDLLFFRKPYVSTAIGSGRKRWYSEQNWGRRWMVEGLGSGWWLELAG